MPKPITISTLGDLADNGMGLAWACDDCYRSLDLTLARAIELWGRDQLYVPLECAGEVRRMRQQERERAGTGEHDHQTGRGLAVRGTLIRRLLARLFRRPPEIRQEATVLVTLHGPQGAWLEARDRRQAAQKDSRWHEDPELRRAGRYWNSVMREIERQTGYAHQSDTATRYLDR
ncbi:MAG TPA: hypothetical protein VGO22_17345 [Pseudorhizobium sp.]|jgi:hypothetical protein|nr:hypothetical protein [Pseudorhizobium sp.]